jgi:hypothetical protein
MSDDTTEALRAVVRAWEDLPGGRNYSPSDVADWLREDMKPAIDKARAVLSPHRWVDATPLVKWPHCSQCGNIKRADGRNSKVCKGTPAVRLREVSRA